MFGQDQGPRLVAVGGGLQHHGQPAPLALTDGDDVASAQGGQRIVGGPAALHARRPRLCALAPGDRRTQSRVLQDRRIASAEFLGDLTEHLLAARHALDQPDDGPVGLVLGEGPLQEPVRLFGAHVLHQVDRHVVRRRERTAQRERPGGSETGDVGGIHRGVVGLPQHDGVPFDVDAAPARPAGQLGVLPRRQRRVLFAVVLHQSFQHDGAGGHVDPQSQCLGGEHRLHQARGEEFLDGVPEHRQQSGVVGGEPAQQAFAPFVVAEHDEVGLGQLRAPSVDHLGDAGPFLVVGQPQRRAQALFDRRVASRPREDERDRREQTLVIQHADHVGARRWSVEGGPAAVISTAGPAASPRLPVGQPVGLPAQRDVPQQFGVHQRGASCGLVAFEQVEQPLADHHVLPQRHRPVLVDDDGGVAAHGLDPATELLGVAHRRRQADQPHLLGQVQDHLLPHRAAHPVGQEVHLVHHDVRKSLQGR